MAFPKIGPMIPGLGVDYTSPAVKPSRQNAINIRATGATTGEGQRFADLAPKGTTTKPPKPISISQALVNTGATYGEGNRFAALAPSGTTVTSTGKVVVPDRPTQKPAEGQPDYYIPLDQPGLKGTPAPIEVPGYDPLPGYEPPVSDPVFDDGTGGGDTGGGDTGGGDTGGGDTGGGDTGDGDTGGGDTGGGATGMTKEQYNQLLASTINELLRGGFIDWQGQQASELRRLQNLYNQLYGTEEGMIGSVQRQEQLDSQARRRLAAQRAMGGMLQGGAYAGAQRGLGTIQQAQQAMALGEMQRPFREQTQADRLREFGLGYDPEAGTAAADRFDMMDWQMYTPEGESWATSTFGGQAAYENARAQAIRELLGRGISI